MATTKKTSWWKRGLQASLALVLFVALSVVWLTQTPWGRKTLLTEVTNFLSQSVFMGNLTAERIDGPIFGEMILRNAVLTDDRGEVVATISQIRAKFTLRELLGMEAHVSRLGAFDAKVYGRIREDGSLNLANLFTPSDPDKVPAEQGFGVFLRSIDIDDLDFEIIDTRTNELVVEMSDSRLVGEFSLERNGDLYALVESLSGNVRFGIAPGQSFLVAIDGVNVNMGEASITFDADQLSVGDTGLFGFEGEIQRSSELDKIFEYLHVEMPELKLNPQEMAVFLPDIPLETILTASVVLNGPPEDVQLVAALSGADQAAALILSLDLAGEVQGDDVGIRGNFAVENFKPELWIGLPGVYGDVTASIDFNVTGLTPQRITAGAELRLQPSTLMGYRLDESWILAEYSNSTARITDMRVNAGSIQVQGVAGYGFDGDVDVNIRIDAPDLSDIKDHSPMAPDIQGSLFASLAVTGRLPKTEPGDNPFATIPSIMDRVLPAFEIQGNIDARSVRLPGLNIGTLKLTLAQSPGSQARLNLVGNAGNLNLGGTRVDTARLRTTITKDRFDLDGSVRAMGADVSIGADGNWSLTGVDLRIRELGLANEQIQVAVMQPVEVSAVLDEKGGVERVTFGNLWLAGDGLDVRSDRFVYNGNGSISGDIRAEVADVRTLTQLVGMNELDVRGGVGLTGVVGGSVEKPLFQATLSPRDLTAMGIGPIRGALTVNQTPTHMAVDGALCLRRDGVEEELSPEGARCAGDDPLLIADAVQLPFLPGFSAVGLKLDETGILAGNAVVGPVQLERVLAEIDSAKPFAPRGVVGLTLRLNGTAQRPDVSMTLDLKDVYARLQDGTANGVVVGPLATTGLLSIGGEEGQPTELWYSLGGKGLTLDGETWLRASGSLRSPIREFLLEEVTLRDAIASTWGNILSIEVPERRLKEIPGRFVPSSIDPETVVYLSADLTKEEFFTGAKISFSANELTFGDVGPVNVTVSAVSSADTQILVYIDTVDLGGEDLPLEIDLSAVLDVSLGNLLARGILPEDRLSARLLLPSTKLDAFPVATLSAQQLIVGFDEQALQTPDIEGYADIFGTLADLRLRSRFRLGSLTTATGAMTEAALEILYGPPTDGSFHEAGIHRLQAGLSVCGPANTCAMELRAAAVVGVKSGDFLFGTPAQVERANARIADAKYAAILQSVDAPIEALAPAWLFTGLATGISGRLNSDLRVDGSLSSIPKVRGTLMISDMVGEILPLARKVEELDLTIRAEEEVFFVDDLYINDGRGTILGSGELKMRNGQPQAANLDLEFDTFLLADATGIGAYLTANVPVTATFSPSGIDVNVEIQNGNVIVPDSILSGTTAGPTELPEEFVLVPDEYALRDFMLYTERRERDPDNGLSDVTSETRIRVNVRNRERVYVTQRFARLYLGMNLALVLDTNGISMLGNVAVSEGEAQVFGKRFDIVNGLVTFDNGGEGPFDPRIELTASHILPRKTAALLDAPSGRNATVSVEMNTRLSVLNVRLVSDPIMSESDILNVLLTGKPIDSGEARPEALTTAGSLLAGYLTDQLGANPVLDTVSVELDDSDGSLDSRFEGGRYFGKENSIYASVAWIAGAEPDENSFEMSWQFILAQLKTSSVRLELRWGNRRTGAAELLYDLRLEKGARFLRGLRRQ